IRSSVCSHISLPSFHHFFFLMLPPPPTSTLFPYTTLFRSERTAGAEGPNAQHQIARLQSVLREANDHRHALHTHIPILRLVFGRSEEHTSELQSRGHLVCRLLLEKKKKKQNNQQLIQTIKP